MNVLEIASQIIVIIATVAPVFVSIWEKTRKTNTASSVNQDVRINNNSNNKYTYNDNRKYQNISKVEINNSDQAINSQGHSTDIGLGAWMALAAIVALLATLLSIIVIKNRIFITIGLLIAWLSTLIYCLHQSERVQIPIKVHEFILHTCLALLGTLLPLISFINIAPVEPFEQYHNRIIPNTNANVDALIVNLVKGMTASEQSALYYISIAIGPLIAVTIIILYFRKSRDYFKSGDVSSLKLTPLLVVSELSVLCSTGIAFWILYYIYVLIMQLAELVKINIPKLL